MLLLIVKASPAREPLSLSDIRENTLEEWFHTPQKHLEKTTPFGKKQTKVLMALWDIYSCLLNCKGTLSEDCHSHRKTAVAEAKETQKVAARDRGGMKSPDLE